MAKKSAGLLMYRNIHGPVEVFLVHPGGPFWAKKDYGAWSIPKGEFSEDEDPLEAARREVKEETGFVIEGEFKPLDPVRQPSGKTIYAWAIKNDVDAAVLKSNTFSVEWPPNSGKVKEFPEVDRASWFTVDTARLKIVKGQVPFLDQLESRIDNGGPITRATSGISQGEISAREIPQQASLFDINKIS